MKYKLSILLIFILAGLNFSCSSTLSGSGARYLSDKALNLVNNAVFEVVLEKPENDSLSYDRAINWDIIPYAIRNDKYYSIGTAFAISQTELITAFHVIDLGFDSMIYKKYFIRDSNGDVFEVDQIVSGSNEKDFLIFTVKDRTFNDFFQFERKYKTGDTVLSIGNAYGEGIVVRSGLVLGTVPEDDSGRWVLLKSSADGNPGNSGGPLVTTDGKVIALVTSLRDNILYSTPASVILDSDRSSLSYRVKYVFSHLILANNFNNTFETNVLIPNDYASIRNKIREAYYLNYDFAMTSLFNEAHEYLTRSNSYFLLAGSLSSSFPEVSYVDPNDNNWRLTDFSVRNFNLNDNGHLMYFSISGYNFYKIKKPSTVPLRRANTDPKFIMDIILQNMRVPRTLGNAEYRINSFGEPFSTDRFVDSLGRTWISAYWLIEYADLVQIMYILPMPDGPVVLSSIQDSSSLFEYEWDMKKICDHLFAAYYAPFSEWADYFAMQEFIPGFLSNMRFQWNSSSRSFSFSGGNIRINLDRNVFDWASDSELFIAPTWYLYNGIPEFGIRNIVIRRDPRGRDSILLYRRVQPDSRMGTNAMDNWNDLVQARFPFDGNPVISARDNTGSIGAILNTGRSADTLYSIYFSMDNPVNEDNLNRRFNALKQGVSITN